MVDDYKSEEEKPTPSYFLAGVGFLILQVISMLIGSSMCGFNCGFASAIPQLFACILTSYYIYKSVIFMQSGSFGELRSFLFILAPLASLTALHLLFIVKLLLFK